jgi:hypothetical protein
MWKPLAQQTIESTITRHRTMRTPMKTVIAIIILLCSPRATAQWEVQSSGVTVPLDAVDAIDDSTVWAAGANGTVLLTTNGGGVWMQRPSPESGTLITTIRALGSTTALIVAQNGFEGYRIWKTMSSGVWWSQVHVDDTSSCEGIEAFGTDTLMSIGSSYPRPGRPWNIQHSGDAGLTWESIDTSRCPAPASHEWVAPLSTASRGDRAWFTTYSFYAPYCRLFQSTNRGYDWTASGTPVGNGRHGYIAFADELRGLILLDGDIPGGHVFRTWNGGLSWSDMGVALGLGYALTVFPGSTPVYFAGGDGGRVSYSIDDGATWTGTSIHSLNTVYAMDAAETRVWAVGANGLIVRGTRDLIVGVEENRDQAPSSFRLEQNYPNPFNSSTTIRYTVPGSAGTSPAPQTAGRHATSLEVVDLLGRRIATLVDGMQTPGVKSVRFDATGLASGVYFYRLTIDDVVQTRTMVLLR